MPGLNRRPRRDPLIRRWESVRGRLPSGWIHPACGLDAPEAPLSEAIPPTNEYPHLVVNSTDGDYEPLSVNINGTIRVSGGGEVYAQWSGDHEDRHTEELEKPRDPRLSKKLEYEHLYVLNCGAVIRVLNEASHLFSIGKFRATFLSEPLEAFTFQEWFSSYTQADIKAGKNTTFNGWAFTTMGGINIVEPMCVNREILP